jgi:hypothetical protein
VLNKKVDSLELDQNTQQVDKEKSTVADVEQAVVFLPVKHSRGRPHKLYNNPDIIVFL